MVVQDRRQHGLETVQDGQRGLEGGLGRAVQADNGGHARLEQRDRSVPIGIGNIQHPGGVNHRCLAILCHLTLQGTPANADLGRGGLDGGVASWMLMGNIAAGKGKGPLHDRGGKFPLGRRRIVGIFVQDDTGTGAQLELGAIQEEQLDLPPVRGLDLLPLENVVPRLQGTTLATLLVRGRRTADHFDRANGPATRPGRYGMFRYGTGHQQPGPFSRQQQGHRLWQEKGSIGGRQDGRRIGGKIIGHHHPFSCLADDQMTALLGKVTVQKEGGIGQLHPSTRRKNCVTGRKSRCMKWEWDGMGRIRRGHDHHLARIDGTSSGVWRLGFSAQSPDASLPEFNQKFNTNVKIDLC